MGRIQSWYDWMDSDRRTLEPQEPEPRPRYARTFIVTPVPPQDDGPITKFLIWYGEAKPGQTYVYYVGYLYEDREKDTVSFLDSLARLVAEYAQKRLVALTQRRLGELQYEYRATKLR